MGKTKTATREYLDMLQERADKMKNRILNNSPDFSGWDNVYYISNRGDDNNDGRTPKTAWASLEKAQTVSEKGSVVLFENGSFWYRAKSYDSIHSFFETKSGVTYSRYGDISLGLPTLSGSRENFAKPEYWVTTEYKNVYECTQKFNNVGIIAFDHDGSLGYYDALAGKMLFKRNDLTLTQKDLSEDLQFWCDTQRAHKEVDTLYLYSEKGNPGERFKSIMIGENVGVMGMSDNCTIDGLRIQHSGGIALGSGGVRGATIKNCIFDWIGGSKLSADSTYGNAIQVYGNAEDCTFDDNWCYQIYDCGITTQHTSGGDRDIHMKNNSMSGNLLEYCYWGIEYWNQKSDTHESSFINVRMDNNFIRFTGLGWGGVEMRYTGYGSEYLAEQSAAICCFGLTPNSSDVSVCGNTFESAHQNFVRMDYYGGECTQRHGNTYVQYEGSPLFRLYGTQYTCEQTSGEDIEKQLGDGEYELVIIPKNL